MLHRPHIWLVIAVLVAIAIVFVAPSLNLAPTALRAWRAVCAIFLAIAALQVVAQFSVCDVRWCERLVSVASRSCARTGPALVSPLIC